MMKGITREEHVLYRTSDGSSWVNLNDANKRQREISDGEAHKECREELYVVLDPGSKSMQMTVYGVMDYISINRRVIYDVLRKFQS